MSRLPIDLACQHLKSVGYKDPSKASSFIAKLLKNNGQKFVIDYISNVADSVRNTLITGEYIIPHGIRTRRYLLKDGTRVKVPAEAWIKSALNSAKYAYDNSLPLDHKVVKKVHAVINLKHVFMFDSVQPHHIDKFNNALMQPTFIKWGGTGNINPRKDYIIRRRLQEASLQEVHVDSLYSYFVTDKKSPIFNYSGKRDFENLIHPIITVESKDPRSRDFTPIVFLYNRSSLRGKELIKSLLPTLLHYKGIREFGYLTNRALKAVSKKNISSMEFVGDVNLPQLSGKISHIMESGGKDRAVAQPFLSLQIVFEPLKRILKNMQKADPYIYTYDQDQGVKVAQECLRNGDTLYCYDATSFTDKFPLSYQIHILNKYNLGPWADLIKAYSEGNFYDPVQRCTVFYQQGQSQGLGPSFALATLSHSEMVQSLYRSIYGRRYERVLQRRPYGVVGDDIFISDESVAIAYDDIMANWGVEINKQKSVISDRYGEFCGVLFDKSSQVPAYKPKEWRLSHDSLSSSINYYGKSWFKTFDLLNRRYPSKKVTESLDDQTIYRYTLASKGGGLKKLGVQSLLNLIKNDINDISSWILSSADYTAPHYAFLESFVREAVNLNYKRGYHANRFRSAGNRIFHIRASDSSGYRTESNESLISRLELLLTENNLQNLFEDAEFLIEFSKNLTSQDDFEAFEELFSSYTQRVNEIYKLERNAHESDPSKEKEVSLKDLLDRSKSTIELLKADPKDVIVTLDAKTSKMEEIDGEMTKVVTPTISAKLKRRSRCP
jgi:hypothetical protein